MKDILIGVVVFAIIFGGALFGMFLGKILPVQHMSTESRDVIRIVMGMLAMLSSVTLGLLTGSSISSLAEREGELRSAGVQFIMLDRTLAEYGPETAPTRTLLKQVLSERISQIWPEEGSAVSLSALSGGPGINLVQRDLFALSPQTERQRWLRSNALEITNTIAESRWTTVEQIGSRFPWAFFYCCRVLASGCLRQFRALRASQCQRDSRIVRCGACTCRPDLYDVRNGSALWWAGQNPQHFAARRLGSAGSIVSRFG